MLTAPVTLHSMWLEVGVRAEAEEMQTVRNSVPEPDVSENKLEQGTAELLSGLNAQCVYNSGGCGKHALRPQQFLSESRTQCSVCKIPVRVSSGVCSVTQMEALASKDSVGMLTPLQSACPPLFPTGHRVLGGPW